MTTDNTDREELEPCPFCGVQGIPDPVNEGWFAIRHTSVCYFTQNGRDITAHNLPGHQNWNTRSRAAVAAAQGDGSLPADGVPKLMTTDEWKSLSAASRFRINAYFSRAIDPDDTERDQAFREFWREQEKERPFDPAHPENYATFTKRYAPPATSSPVSPSLIPEQSIEFTCRVCGVQCVIAPDPPDRAVCPEHCEDHDYRHDRSRAGKFCIHCDQQQPEDWDDD